MRYNQRIRALREEMGFTQQRIADQLNVGQRTYCDYEQGKTRIPVDSIVKLAKLYNVSVDYIVGASDIKGIFPIK